jgi:hypothetical protein
MPRKRPTAVLVVAILGLIGGSLDLLVTLFTAFQLAGGTTGFAMPGAAQPGGAKGPQELANRMTKQLEEAVPAQKIITPVTLGVSLVLDLLLLAGGIGLLNMKRWGRSAYLVYAPLSIISRLFGVVFELVFVVPAMSAIVQQEVQRDPNLRAIGSVMEMGLVVGLLLGSLFIAFPIVVLIILLRPSIAAAFRSGAEGMEDEGEFPRDEWEGPSERDERIRE